MLFAMLGAGVTIIKVGSKSLPRDTNVTTITAPESATSLPTPTVIPSESPSSSPTPSAVPSPTKDRITVMEDAVTLLINKAREGVCGTPVRTDERLRTAARRHSADMARNDYFSHEGLNGSTFSDRVAAAGYPRRSAASENIAAGYMSAKAVVDGWLTSEGHRRNILDCTARAVGVGLAYRGTMPYWTQDFGRS